jgi:hypothetical protein
LRLWGREFSHAKDPSFGDDLSDPRGSLKADQKLGGH